MQRNRRYRPVAEINVVPYIDVMLVLLVIFMVTAPMLFQGVDVNLPTATSKPIESKQAEPIVLSIDRQNHYFLNIVKRPTQEISKHELLIAITNEIRLQAGKERQFLIKADKTITYEKVVQAMSLLQQAGVKNIGLITESPST